MSANQPRYGIRPARVHLVALLVYAVAAVATADAQQQPANICSGLPVGTAVRNTQSCSTFYSCQQNGRPILTPCPGGQLFNHIDRRCDANRDAVSCYSCPDSGAASGGFADWPVPNECQQFVRCIGNSSEQRTCADGLRFDRRVSLCNRAERVPCEFEVECPRQTQQPIFTRHPDDCARFTVCANGERLEFRCPESLHLNLNTKQCDTPANSNCSNTTQPPPTTSPPPSATTEPVTEAPPPPPPLLQCPRKGGPLFPHPTDCALTYTCSTDDKPSVYPCREGLYFDYEQQYCAPPNVVKCFGDVA